MHAVPLGDIKAIAVQNLVTLNDLVWRNGRYLALFYQSCSEAYCVTMVDKTVPMDNVRLLYLVVNVCSGTARRSFTLTMSSSDDHDAHGINS